MNSNVSLTDADLCRFLDEGYLLLDTSSIPDATHDRLFESASRLHQLRTELSDPLASLDAIADKLHDQVPLLNELLAHPVVDGALETVLGPSYFRYDHSYIHQSGPFDQSYHKDSPLPWSTPGGMRSHRPNWAMIFYYPQAVTADMGPTEILPGTQYWNVNRHQATKEGEDRFDTNHKAAEFNQLSEDERESRFAGQRAEFDRFVKAKRLVVPKGSMVLVHFDLFHRGTRSNSSAPRYLYKFWYTRTLDPPIAQAGRRVYSYQALDTRRQPLIRKQAAWLGLDLEGKDPRFVGDEVEQEAERLACDYLRSNEDHESLVTAACSGDEAKRRSAIYALVGHDEGSRLVIENLSDSERDPERNCAAFLRGELSSPRFEELEDLVKVSSNDASRDVRLTATNALGRALRRRMVLDQVEVPEDLLEQWESSLVRAEEHTMRAGIVISAERQCIYTAMLNFVTSGLACHLYLPAYGEISRLLRDRLPVETDRYARATAQEVLSRLAQSRVLDAPDAFVPSSDQEQSNKKTLNA